MRQFLSVLFLGILADGLTFFVGFCRIISVSRIISVQIMVRQTVKSSLHLIYMGSAGCFLRIIPLFRQPVL